MCNNFAYNFPIEWPLERVNDAEHCITLLISPSTMECIAGELYSHSQENKKYIIEILCVNKRITHSKRTKKLSVNQTKKRENK